MIFSNSLARALVLSVAVLGALTPYNVDAATAVTIGGSPATQVAVNAHYSFQATATNPNHRTLEYSISNHPSWTTFNKATGLLTGSYSRTGTFTNIKISVTDGLTTAALPLFQIRVGPTSSGSGTTGGGSSSGGSTSGGSSSGGTTSGGSSSGGSSSGGTTGGTGVDVTSIGGTPATTAVAGKTYSFQPTAKNSLGRTLTYAIANKPSWASFSTTSGMLSGMPASSNVGTYSNIGISATDGSTKATLSAFAIAVTAASGSSAPPTGSAAPTIAGTPTTSVVAGQGYSFTPSTTDPSGKALTFSVANKPSWATFNSVTGMLSGTPTAAGSFGGIGISVSDGTNTASLAAFTITVTAASTVSSSPTTGGPQVLYTDIISGPNSGGENNNGAYLSIFGKNFGSTGLGSTVTVTIGSSAVAKYIYLGASKGRSDIQQITVQVGALGNQAAGSKLPIKVAVNGVASNTDQTFMINPGRFLYVDNVSGNDSTAVIGDITHPYRHVQTSTLSAAAWGQAKPGDFIVMRGKGTAWTDQGFENYFMRYRDKSGSAPTGASGTGAIVLMGYPTEDVFIQGLLSAGNTMGCVSAINGQSFPGMGQWAVISNLRIDCQGYDGPISQEIAGNNWRVVNNDLAASTAPTSGSSVPRMAGITGNGSNSYWVGNGIHDIQGSDEECHGIYIDGDGSYEIAYNRIQNIRSGNGFQIYVNGGNGSTVANNVNFHHNIIHDVSKHGINIADGSSAGISVWDNVVYNTAIAGIRFNTETMSGGKIYNNTFYNINTGGNNYYGVLTNEWALPSNSVTIENNIFWPAANIPYVGGSMPLTVVSGTTDHNLWYGGQGSTLGSSAITSNPAFNSASGDDFHLTSSSPAIGAGNTAAYSTVTTDYDVRARSSSTMDVGAYTH